MNKTREWVGYEEAIRHVEQLAQDAYNNPLRQPHSIRLVREYGQRTSFHFESLRKIYNEKMIKLYNLPLI